MHLTKSCSPFKSLVCMPPLPVKPLLVTLPSTLVLSCCGPQHTHYISFPLQPGGSLSIGTVFSHHTSRIPVQSLTSSKCSMRICWVNTTEGFMLAAFVPFLRITPLGLVTTTGWMPTRGSRPGKLIVRATLAENATHPGQGGNCIISVIPERKERDSTCPVPASREGNCSEERHYGAGITRSSV